MHVLDIIDCAYGVIKSPTEAEEAIQAEFRAT